MSTSNVQSSGNDFACSRNASLSLSNAVMNEWAIVPTGLMPYAAAAPTLLVPSKPAMYADLANAYEASMPCVRLAAKSTTGFPFAASTTLEALVARIVCMFTMLISRVSTS